MKRTIKLISFPLMALAILFLVFLGVISLSDYRPENKMDCQVQGKAVWNLNSDTTMTIQTWNLGYFGLGKDNDFFYDGGKMTRPSKEYYATCADGAINYITQEERCDFYFFQEVDLPSYRSYHDNQMDRLMASLPGFQAVFAMNYNVLFVPMPINHPMRRVRSGIVTFSAYPSSENTRIALPGGFSWPVGLFMLDRCFMLIRINLPSGHDLVLINTHNEAFDDGTHRKQQMNVLRETMLKEYGLGNYVITGGDWNLNPRGYNKLSFINGDIGRDIRPPIDPDFLPGEWEWAYDPDIPSNRDVDQPYAKGITKTTIIDFFVLSPNVKLIDISTADLGFQWSDHHPVRIKIRLV